MEQTHSKTCCTDDTSESPDVMVLIQALADKLETQRQEYELNLNEGYEEAYKMLMAERDRANRLETELYDEYEDKLHEIKNYMVDKIDVYLRLKIEELNDIGMPELAQKVQVWKDAVGAKQIVSDAIGGSDEDVSLKEQVKLLEAKCMRLNFEKHKAEERFRLYQGGIVELGRQLSNDVNLFHSHPRKRKISGSHCTEAMCEGGPPPGADPCISEMAQSLHKFVPNVVKG